MRLILNNHPEIAIPYESGFISKYYENLKNYGDLQVKKNVEKLLNDILNEENLKLWDYKFSKEHLLSKILKPDFSSILTVIYEEYCRYNKKNRWGDKSDTLLYMDIINKLFPECQFIHIIRDGRDVALSVMKQKWGPSNIVDAAQWWRDNLCLGRSMGAMLCDNRYLEIRYEDLISNIEMIVKNLCKYLNVKFSPLMLEYYKNIGQSVPAERLNIHYNLNKPPDSSRIFAWKKEMNKSDVEIFEKYSGNLLHDLGYETDFNKKLSISSNIKLAYIYFQKFYSN